MDLGPNPNPEIPPLATYREYGGGFLSVERTQVLDQELRASPSTGIVGELRIQPSING